MNDLREVCKVLAPKVRAKIISRIMARYEILKDKVTKQGKPYNVTYLNELLQLAQTVKLEPLIENTILRLRETSENEPTSIHTFVGSTVPKELEYCTVKGRLARLGQWATMFLDALVDFHIIEKSNIKIEAKAKNKSYGNEPRLMDGYYLNRQALVQNYDCEGITQPNKKPRMSHRVLGTIWAKNGHELDHNDIALNLLNNTPLTFNQDVMEKLGYEFKLAEPDKKDWDSVKFPEYKDWVEAREKAHKAYISKLPEYIKGEESGVVYNTYAPDSRGRLYPTNDTGNFVGIKYIRAVIQSAEPDKIELE